MVIQRVCEFSRMDDSSIYSNVLEVRKERMSKFTNFFLWVCSFIFAFTILLAFGQLLMVVMEYLGIDLANTINHLIFG